MENLAKIEKAYNSQKTNNVINGNDTVVSIDKSSYNTIKNILKHKKSVKEKLLFFIMLL